MAGADAPPPAPPQQPPHLLEATLYKGTTLPHIVVKRRCVLGGEGGRCGCATPRLAPAQRRERAAPNRCAPRAARRLLLRRARAAGFTTFQVDKPPSSGKLWQLHRKATLEPAAAGAIRLHERHLRKAGPLRALSAYARDKNVLKLVSGGAR